MANQSLETKIEINAPASKVWRMFTDPDFTRQMGGEYVSDWKVGSSLGWRGMDGNILTKGIIKKIEPERLLQHSLFVSPDSESIMATLIYELEEKDNKTFVRVTEDFTDPITDQEYIDSMAGWEAALSAAKELAEK